MPFNKPYEHPERQKGEVFITNIKSLRSSSWKTHRLGSHAYDIYDKPIAGVYPMFVSEAEVNSESPGLITRLEEQYPDRLKQIRRLERYSIGELDDDVPRSS